MSIQLTEDETAILLVGDKIACCSTSDNSWNLATYFPRTSNQGPCVNSSFGGVTVTNPFGVPARLKAETSIFIDDLLLADGVAVGEGPEFCKYDDDGNLLCCKTGSFTLGQCSTLKTNVPAFGSVVLTARNHFGAGRIMGYVKFWAMEV